MRLKRLCFAQDHPIERKTQPENLDIGLISLKVIHVTYSNIPERISANISIVFLEFLSYYENKIKVNSYAFTGK
jgi:hypothetical protein